jgi:hypothetical protein
MTQECSVFIALPNEVAAEVADLAERADSCLGRSRKLPPGDRTEAVRFENIHACIDQIAVAALAQGAQHFIQAVDPQNAPQHFEIAGSSLLRPSSVRPDLPNDVKVWLANSKYVVELRLPHARGPTELPGVGDRGPPPPALTWFTQSGAVGRSAIRERFEFLLSKALANPHDSEAAILPSGVTNTVLTETLRKGVDAGVDGTRIDLPVRYRDGSSGALFPMKALRLTDRIAPGWRELKFTLMSIRHVEMDEIVDGAWLRNSRISQRREAGFTDQLVFEISQRQLNLLTANGPIVLHMYQTGLEPAIVGFYRAVTFQLLEKPGSLIVVPQYWERHGTFSGGSPWATA